MSPERIIIINDFSAETGGGTAVLALLSARLLAAAGFEVVYVAGDVPQSPPLPPEVEVVALGAAGMLQRPLASRIIDGLYHAKAKAMIDDVIARHDSPRTIYHLHGWAQILSPAAFHA